SHIDTKDIFQNDKPTYLELGMGKGSFIIDNAIKYQDINFIGIEKYATVVLYALKNYKDLSKDYDIKNLKMMCFDIKDILTYLKEKSIDKIYLNFSDPWPKKRHENRRLTSKYFLDIYKKLLKDNATIEFKTDNVSLFDYSIESFKDNSYNIQYMTHDLYSDKDAMISNIQTEYEKKFSKKGQKICKLIATT
ncbi:MAG: tRNA (guanosine(46)-N7)-methyltransferase TrmB, partial [Lachnospiraceae bacterium]|nr:tRNA (guanosine(46)-N7)-methyltransferase TrmB [Lachnospiraceae bacterium]